MVKVVQALGVDNSQLFGWTDSTVVLSWLSEVPRTWKTYVANRTSEILDSIPRSSWRHVPSSSNPADCASRGLHPSSLIEHHVWWKGPPWLSSEEAQWPRYPSNVHPSPEATAEKKLKFLAACQQVTPESTLASLSTRFSSWSKLIRVLAYTIRFISNSRANKTERSIGYLNNEELNDATRTCLNWVQETSFAKEIEQLKKKNSISSKSVLRSLNPFLGDDGLLRVGGRLQHSSCSYNTKHPIILPKSNPITTLLVSEMHARYLHPGISLLISILRQNYWIIGVRNIVKGISHKCMTCFRSRHFATQQLMGDLPKPRVSISRPFQRCGVDYAGPFTLSTKTGRGAKTMKGYIALFVCLSTKALHLELVSSLSSEAFIAALRRFISRRGIPQEILCDNGTNFIGAKRCLTDLHRLALSSHNDPLITHFFSQNNINWKFIPPAAPNFGGLWEAGVKAVKTHLRRVVGDKILTFEEMATLLHQIEAILNSRPLCQLSTEPDDLDVLTPAHFLIGQPLTTLPEPDLHEIPVSTLGRWQHVQALMQGFWRRWQRDYLTSLQQRPKWRQPTESLKPGELVIIREERLPPSKWLLGRIEQIHPGADGHVRVADIKTAKGTLRRAVSKICRLPTD